MTGKSVAGATVPPSASGARLTGDDLQHLIGWYHALRMLRPENEIEYVTFESLGSGNLDDVVVTYATAGNEYMQIKAVVSAGTPVGSDWLLAPGRNGGPSILQRFWQSWQQLQASGGAVQLRLVTNRSVDHSDAVMGVRDRNNLLADGLRRAKTGASAEGRTRWAQHLDISDEQLCDMLDVLHFDTDASESSWRQRVVDVSQGLGLRADEAALLAGIGQVREWIKDSRQSRTPTDVRDAIARLGLRLEEPYSVLVVQALDRSDVPDTAEALDWVDRFVGDGPRTRRGLHRPEEWNTVLQPELEEAARRARLQSHRVLVQGAMRLPTWFAVGAHLSEVSGAMPSASQSGEIWSAADAKGTPLPDVVVMDEEEIGSGSDLALTIAISADGAPDVRAFLRGSDKVGTHLTMALSPGPDRQAIASSAAAASAAVALRDAVRQLARERGVSRLHLFLVMPGVLALLLGHFWSRMPPTQTYEDLVSGGYEPAFLVLS